MLLDNGVDDEIGDPSELVRRLLAENLIDELGSDALMRLLEIRNMAVHAPVFDADPEVLSQFVRTKERMMRLIFGSTDP